MTARCDDRVTRTLPATVADSTASGDDVLVCCPSVADEESSACADLSTLGPPERTNVVAVTTTDSPLERRAIWDRHVERAPARMAVVSVETDTRSPQSGVEPVRNERVTQARFGRVETVSSPTDLTELGLRITEVLSEWRDDANDRRTVLCFHSLTALLQSVPVERLFKFVHVLANLPLTEDVTAHYHLDPTVHDEVTVRTLAELFDVVYERGETWEVSR
ncbi:hypothetical protein BRD06_04045 [Halobacteriales archaeon QS_9_67_15]|nr:MAG: hypothetical protein BRD06_04045 [Halobacteriales archaeon QS_9_67_15]